MAGDQPNIVARSSTRTLERGLAILDCYDLDHWGHTLTEICSQTGLAKATAFRLLKTLERCGYLTMDPVTNRYCLGPSMMKAAYVMVSHAELERLAHPLLEKLVRHHQRDGRADGVGRGAHHHAWTSSPRPSRSSPTCGPARC